MEGQAGGPKLVLRRNYFVSDLRVQNMTPHLYRGQKLVAPDGLLPKCTAQEMTYNTNPTVNQTNGLLPDNMCILKGLPTVLAKANPLRHKLSLRHLVCK